MPISITLIIIIVTVIVSIQGFNNKDFLYRMAFSPYEVKHSGKQFKFITHIFVHSDWMHLAFNMLSFYFLADILLYYTAKPVFHINDGLIPSYGVILGSAHFLILYFLGGLFATVWPMIRNHNNPNYVSLGASGAVSSVVFAMILWNPNMELSFMFLPFPIKAYIFGPLYLAFEFWSFKRGKSNIAHDAHIGGAIFGVVYILIINIDKGKELFHSIKEIFV